MKYPETGKLYKNRNRDVLCLVVKVEHRGSRYLVEYLINEKAHKMIYRYLFVWLLDWEEM